MTQTFDEFLQMYYAENYPTLDDLLPEAYADWLCDVEVERLIELAEKWHKQETDKVYLQGAKDMLRAIKKMPQNRFIDFSDEGHGYETAVEELDKKAQQFLDSLEVKNDKQN